MRTSIYILFFLFVSCNQQRKVENDLLNYYNENASYIISDNKLIETIGIFENYLFDRKLLVKNDKKSYLELINSAQKAEVVINIDSLNKVYPDLCNLSSPSNIVFNLEFLYRFVDYYNLVVDSNSTLAKTSNVMRNYMDTIIAADQLKFANSIMSEGLISSINQRDFNKIIYRANVVFMIYTILETNYYLYHIWKPIKGISFIENDTILDFDGSDFNNLDSLCKILIPENKKIVTFISIKIDTAESSDIVELNKARVMYLLNYLIQQKNIHPGLIKSFYYYRDCEKKLKDLHDKKRVDLLYQIFEYIE